MILCLGSSGVQPRRPSLPFVSFVVLCEESPHIRSKSLQSYQFQVQVWHRVVTRAICVRVYARTCSSRGTIEAHHVQLQVITKLVNSSLLQQSVKQCFQLSLITQYQRLQCT